MIVDFYEYFGIIVPNYVNDPVQLIEFIVSVFVALFITKQAFRVVYGLLQFMFTGGIREWN